MNRRSFFKWLGVGTAAAVVAPSAFLEKDVYLGGIRSSVGAKPYVDALKRFHPIDQFNDYTNFSSFAVSSAIDGSVEKAAQELAEAYGRKVNELTATVGQ